MSQENVEIVRRAAEAMDPHDVSQLLELCDPDIVYHPRADEPDPSPHVGRDAYERLVRGFVETVGIAWERAGASATRAGIASLAQSLQIGVGIAVVHVRLRLARDRFPKSRSRYWS
jgi:SnoaL-like domain